MADTKISALGASVALVDTDEFPINHGGTTQKGNLRKIGAYVGDVLHAEQFATPAQSLPASATTYMTGSAITVPTGERVKLNTWFRWRFLITKTAAGTVAQSVLVKWGTAGTTADATLATLTLPVGTAVADQADFDVLVGFRSIGAGTAAVVVAALRMMHNLQITGWATIPTIVLAPVVSAGFNSDVDLSKMGLAFVAGASYVLTVPFCVAEAKNL
jgi:hypothetical protein